MHKKLSPTGKESERKAKGKRKESEESKVCTLKTLTFKITVDVDMGGVTDHEVVKAIVEKWYNRDDLHIERDLIDDEDNEKYAFVESVCISYIEDQ